MAKRTVQMKSCGIPSAGTNPKKFLGFRSPVNSSRGEWQHKNPLIDLRHSGDRGVSYYKLVGDKGYRIAVKIGYKFRSYYRGVIGEIVDVSRWPA